MTTKEERAKIFEALTGLSFDEECFEAALRDQATVKANCNSDEEREEKLAAAMRELDEALEKDGKYMPGKDVE